MPPTDGIRVMVIDDSPSDAALIAAKLKHSTYGNFALQSMPSLEVAMNVLANTHFDAVLLDLRLPDVDELDGLAHLVSTHPDLAVLVLTGVANDEMSVKAIRLGAQDYLVKQTHHHADVTRRIIYAVERMRILNAARARS